MNYQTYQPHPDLESLVKCYWTLEVPADSAAEKQRIVPDGCLELIFMLGDDIMRYTSDYDFVIQPRAFVVGQLTEPFVIQPTGYVHCFGVRFYPFGFSNFVTAPLINLANKETPIEKLFGTQVADQLEQKIVAAEGTAERIELVSNFLMEKLQSQTTIDHVVRSTVDVMLATKGNTPVSAFVEDDRVQRRNLERKFAKQIGISPKQLGKVIRLQSALKLMLNQRSESLTRIAYEAEYFDQAHFNRDFKEFTGINPKDFLDNNRMLLSSVFYTTD